MGDLTYATLTILIIWAGIFCFLLVLDRRLRRLEQAPGAGRDAEPDEAIRRPVS